MSELDALNLDLIRVFCRVAEAGTMTDAAKMLFVTQPSVSRSVTLLESQLGCRLFARGLKRLTLTHEGRILYAKASAALALLAEGRSALERCRGLEEGVIDIGATHVVMRYYLLPILARFHALYPQVRLRMHTENMLELLEMQKAGKTDLSVVATPSLDAEVDGALDALPLRTYRYTFICSPEYDAALCAKSQTLADIAKRPLIVLRKGTQTRDVLETRFAAEGLTLSPEMECDMMTMIVDFAAAGFGVGAVITPVYERAAVIMKAPIAEVRLRRPFDPGCLVLLSNRSVPLSPAAEALRRVIREMPESAGPKPRAQNQAARLSGYRAGGVSS